MYPCINDWWGTCTSSTRKFGGYWLAKNANFQATFARNASAVTASEKVQLTLLGSPLPLCAFRLAKDEY